MLMPSAVGQSIPPQGPASQETQWQLEIGQEHAAGSSLSLASSAISRAYRQKRILNPIKCSHCTWLSRIYVYSVVLAGAQPELREDSAKCQGPVYVGE